MAQLMPLPLTVSCFSKIQIGFTFLVPARLGSPRQMPLNMCSSFLLLIREQLHSCSIVSVFAGCRRNITFALTQVMQFVFFARHFTCSVICAFCLQCFGAVVWAVGRASDL